MKYLLFLILITCSLIIYHSVAKQEREGVLCSTFINQIYIPYYKRQGEHIPPSKPVKEFFIKTKKNQNLHGWEYISHPNKPFIIFTHGNADGFPDILENHPNLIYTYPPFSIARRANLNVIMIQYPSYGLSEGHASENSLVESAMLAIQRAKFHNSEAIIYLMGYSLGTGVMTHTAYKMEKMGTPPNKVILIAPYQSMKHMGYEVFWDWIVDAFFFCIKDKHEYNSLYFLKSLKSSFPLFIVHGKKDSIISFHHLKKLKNNLPTSVKNKTVIRVYDQANHFDIWDYSQKDMMDFLLK